MFWLMAVLLPLPWLAVGWLIARAVTSPPASAVKTTERLAGPGDDATRAGNPGPWGTLELTRIVIEPPEAFISHDLSWVRKTAWFFRGYTAEMLLALWQTAGLSNDDQTTLMTTAKWNITDNTVTFEPPPLLVLGLSPAARARIYEVWAAFPENAAQANPYRFRADVADEWLGGSGLSDSTIAGVKRLLYQRGNTMMFSDHDMFLPTIESPQERLRLLKTLSRVSTILAKLRIAPETDVRSLVSYWASGGRAKDLKSLLESIPRRPGGFGLDICHLLPPFARRRLYTYPFPSDNPESVHRDCHWTSMNFFRETPEDRFMSTDYVKQVLETDYYLAQDKPTYGDVMFLSTAEGTAMHSCVYIAADVVFTKNGPYAYIPWTLMELSDVLATYPANPPLQVRVYRAKNSP